MPGQPGSNPTSEGNNDEAITQSGKNLQDLNVSGASKDIDCPGASTESKRQQRLTATHVVPQDAAPAAHGAAQLLGYRLRVEVIDGRILEGDFSCLDTRGNMVLSNAHQICDGPAAPRQQQMGQVLLPPGQRAACSVLAMPNEVDRLTKLIQTGC